MLSNQLPLLGQTKYYTAAIQTPLKQPSNGNALATPQIPDGALILSNAPISTSSERPPGNNTEENRILRVRKYVQRFIGNDQNVSGYQR